MIEQRMVFGLNGEGFIIPLMIRLKLENMNDDFGVCALLTSVNYEKEYLFISNDGQIMDVTKRLYQTIFKDISSIGDLRGFDIKHFIPLIWGIQEVNEYDKLFYSVMVVSKNILFGKQIKIVELNSHKKMQEIVDAISFEDDIYSISFKMCIITTSIGLNFKFVEFESIKKEERIPKKKIHIQNLKRCLNEILKNDLIVLFTNESTDLQNPSHSPIMNDHSQIFNEGDSSFIRHKNTESQVALPIQMSSSLKEFGDDSSFRQGSSEKGQNRYQKYQIQHANIRTSKHHHHQHRHHNQQQSKSSHPSHIFEDDRHSKYCNFQGEIFSLEIFFTIQSHLREEQSKLGKTADQLPSKREERHLTQDVNKNFKTSMENLATNMPLISDRQRLLDGSSQVETQTPITLRNIGITPFGVANSSSKQKQTEREGIQQIYANFNSGKIDDGVKSDTLLADGKSIVKITADSIKPGYTQSKQNPQAMKQASNLDFNHQLHQDEHELLRVIEEDDKQEYPPSLPGQDQNVPGSYNQGQIFRQLLGDERLIEQQLMEEGEDPELMQDGGQNEMIGSYLSLMKSNQEFKNEKTKKITAILQQQNAARQLQSYNEEMKANQERVVIDNIQTQDSVINPVLVPLKSGLDGAPTKGTEIVPNKKKKQPIQEEIPSSEDRMSGGDRQSINEYGDEEGDDTDNDDQAIAKKAEERRRNRKETDGNNNNAAQSVNSSTKTSEEQKRKTIVRRIKSHYISQGLKMMVYIGGVAFAIFCVLSLVFYTESSKSYEQYLQGFQRINSAPLMYIDVLCVAKIFSYISLISNQNFYQEDQELVLQRLDFFADQYRTIMLKFITQDSGQAYQGPLLDSDLEISFYHFDGVVEYSIQKKKEATLLAMQEYLFIINQMKNQQFTKSNNDFLWKNQESFRGNMNEMQHLIEDQSRDYFTNIQQIQIMMLLIILAITSLLIFTVIPLGIYNIIKREEILRLFGCFHPEKLQAFIDQIEICANKLEQAQRPRHIKQVSKKFKKSQTAQMSNDRLSQMRRSIRKSEKESVKKTQTNETALPVQKTLQDPPNVKAIVAKIQIKRLAHKRTRQIASFTQIKRLDISIMLFAVIIIIVMMIAPFLNILFSNTYITEGKVTLQERIIMLDTIQSLVHNQACHFALWQESFSPSFPISRESLTIIEAARNVTKENPIVISALQEILNPQITRREQSAYNSFYRFVLEDDICTALVKYPQYFKSQFSEEKCRSFSKGVMTRGFIMAAKSLIDLFSSAFSIYEKSIQDTNGVFLSYLQDEKIRDINHSLMFLMEAYEATDLYSQQAQQNYNDYVDSTLLYLFVFYLIIVISFFFYGWIHIFIKFNSDFQSTKRLLCLFNLNIILENAFLMQFLKNNDFGIK